MDHKSPARLTDGILVRIQFLEDRGLAQQRTCDIKKVLVWGKVTQVLYGLL